MSLLPWFGTRMHRRTAVLTAALTSTRSALDAVIPLAEAPTRVGSRVLRQPCARNTVRVCLRGCGEPLAEAVQVDAMKRLRLLELDEERFGLDTVHAIAPESVNGGALPLEVTLAFGSAQFGRVKVTLKRRAIHAA